MRASASHVRASASHVRASASHGRQLKRLTLSLRSHSRSEAVRAGVCLHVGTRLWFSSVQKVGTATFDGLSPTKQDLSTGQKLYHLQKLLECAIQVEHDRAEMVNSIAKKAFGSATMRFD